MKIKNSKGEGLELSKRTYVNAKLTHTCECGNELERDFSDSYLSYPIPGGDGHEVTLYCEWNAKTDSDGCGAEYNAIVVLQPLKLKLEDESP